MNCKKCAESMSEYLDNCLAEPARAAFEAHISECARCAEELEAMEEMLAGLSGLSGQKCPADCWAYVREQTAPRETAGSVLARALLRPVVAVPALAAIFMLALILLGPARVEEPRMPVRYVSGPEISRYISAHSRVQREQTFVDPDVTFVAAELEKVNLSTGEAEP